MLDTLCNMAFPTTITDIRTGFADLLKAKHSLREDVLLLRATNKHINKVCEIIEKNPEGVDEWTKSLGLASYDTKKMYPYFLKQTKSVLNSEKAVYAKVTAFKDAIVLVPYDVLLACSIGECVGNEIDVFMRATPNELRRFLLQRFLIRKIDALVNGYEEGVQKINNGDSDESIACTDFDNTCYDV